MLLSCGTVEQPPTAIPRDPPGRAVAAAVGVLIVEDDESIVELLRGHCQQQGYRVGIARDGIAALQQLRSDPPDLVLLDIVLPQLDGWAVLEAIRRESDVPVIFLTSLDGTDDVVRGLTLGADDYLPKPFELRELDARIGAALRRTGLVPRREVVHAGPICIDERIKRVSVNGCEISLTPKEFGLLRLLASDVGRVYSPEEILARLWRDSTRASSADVKQYVHLLRGKLARAGARDLIRTVNRFGYQLVV